MSEAETGTELPLSLPVTKEVQDLLVERSSRLVVGSPALALPLVALAAGGGVLATAAELGPPGIVLLVVLPMAYWLYCLIRMRLLFRRAFPIGQLLRAEVTADQLSVMTEQGAAIHPWSYYSRLRVTDDLVVLRARPQRLYTRFVTQILPRALFRQVDLDQLRAAVPKSF